MQFEAALSSAVRKRFGLHVLAADRFVDDVMDHLTDLGMLLRRARIRAVVLVQREAAVDQAVLGDDAALAQHLGELRDPLLGFVRRHREPRALDGASREPVEDPLDRRRRRTGSRTSRSTAVSILS